MARTPWNKGLTKEDPRVAAAEAKRLVTRVYESDGGKTGRQSRYMARLRERDPLGLMSREKTARRNAKALGNYVESVDYRMVIARDGWVCSICGDKVVADDLSFDHAKPLRDGGEHIFENIHVAHAACNSRKGEMESREVRVAALRKRGKQPSL